MEEARPVVLFDGVCNLCNGFVNFAIERDEEARLSFAPLQSDVADELLADCDGRYDDPDFDGIVLVDEDGCHGKSSAVLRIAKYLGLPYSLLHPFRFVPSRVRDFFYDFVAARRYNWFGKRDECMVPTEDVKSRFLVEPRREPKTEAETETEAEPSAGA